ncbi:MAG TPA: EamA family transporter [Selenomonadales bacterium]|nr:EamA family transporter [Selenomonadales bacterium]
MLPEIFRDSDRARGIALLAITAVLWSTSGFGIKWIDWNPMAIAGARSAVAAVVIWAAFRQSPLRWNRPMLYGGAAYAVMMLTFVAANKLTTAANAVLLQYTSPVYVAILSALFLREKPRLYDWATIGLIGGGIVLFFQDQMTAGTIGGNLLAIASGIAMAVMVVAMRRQKEGSPFGSVLLGNLLTFFCGLPFMVGGEPGVTGWTVIIALGSVQTGLAYVLYSIAIKKVTALEASLITVIEPILNPIWVFLLVGEGPGPWALLGGSIILTAIAARCVWPALKPNPATGIHS